MSNDINDKNYPFSGSATDLSSMDERPTGSVRKDDKSTKSLQDLISSDNLSLSQQLIRLRQSSNLNIEQLADITKIRSEFIQALEDEDFSKLPGLVFAKGFIKNLARFYKVADTSLLEAFDRVSSNQNPISPKDTQGQDNSLSTQEKHPSSYELTAENILDDASKSINTSRGSSGKGGKAWKFFTFSLIVVAVLMILGFISYLRSSKEDEFVLEDSTFIPEESGSLSSDDTSSSTTQQVGDENISSASDSSQDTASSNTTNSDLSSSKSLPTDQPTEDMSNTGNTGNTNSSIAQPQPSEPVDTAGTSLDSSKKTDTNTNANTTPLVSTLSMNISCPTTIRTKSDYSSWQEQVFQPGQNSFEFKNVFHIFITDSSCVSLSMNEVSLGDLSIKGKERRLTFFHNQVAKEIN